MLKDNEVSRLSDKLIEEFNQLELFVLDDIGKFMAKNTSTNPNTLAYKRKVASSLGISDTKIKKEIARVLELSNKEVDALYHEIAMLSDDREFKQYVENGYQGMPYKDNDFLIKLTNNKILAMQEIIASYTDSIGLKGTTFRKAYLNALDMANLQVSTGVITYDQAVANATRDLAKKGITTISYSSGSVMSLQSAIRRAVITDGNQLALRLTEERVLEMGVEMVEISSHSGARPDHARWQGRVIPFNELKSITGYGSSDGLGGANCRHTFHPFFESSKKAPKEKEPKPKEYNGKTYTLYEANQKQRLLERKMRGIKKDITLLESANIDTTKQNTQLKAYQKQYREFSSAMDIPKQYARTRAY